jgi:hypothetical protein
MGTRIFGMESRPANAEPWTLERSLHVGLAAVAIMGWALAYTALTRGIEGSQDIARSESAGTKVSVNLAP